MPENDELRKQAIS